MSDLQSEKGLANEVTERMKRRRFIHTLAIGSGAAALGVLATRKAKATENCSGYTCTGSYKCSTPINCSASQFHCDTSSAYK